MVGSEGRMLSKLPSSPSTTAARSFDVTSELSFVGCFASDPNHPFVEKAMWPEVLSRGRVNSVKSCALLCMDSPWFAMNSGFCQCSEVLRVTHVLQDCGARCGGEESSQPPSYCGYAAASGGPPPNAVYTQNTGCGQLGAYVKLDAPLRRVAEKELWKGVVKVPHWQEGAIVDLDWGDLNVELGGLCT